MPAYTTYYLNGPTLGSATAVFTNPDLTILAPDGYYSDGTIARYQTGGVLSAPEICPSCGAACNQAFVSGKFANTGVYKVAINLGNTVSDVGAVIIEVATPDDLVGYIADFNGNLYNAFSSQTSGLLMGTFNLPTFVGVNDCGVVAGSPWTIDGYIYSDAIHDFGLASPETFSVVAGQIKSTVANPSKMVMVIPKPNATPSTLNLTIYGPCGTPNFDVRVYCPNVLPPFHASENRTTATSACQYPDNRTYYSAPVNGNGTLLGLYDWVFSDQGGQFTLADGYYYAPTACPMPYDWFRVKNGIVVAFGECSVGSYIITRCADGQEFVAGSLVPDVMVGNFVTIENPLYGGCVFEVTATSTLPHDQMIDSITSYESCSDVCVSYSVYNSDGVNPHDVYYTDCNGTPQSIKVSPNNTQYICAKVGSTSGDPSLIIEFDSCSC